MPMLQNRRPEDYECCADALWLLRRPAGILGVGSMCRRPVAGPEGVVAVIAHLHQILPAGIRLHAFGVKGSALPNLAQFGDRVASIDSQAYGVAARRDALRRNIAKSDRLVAAHLECWIALHHATLAKPPRSLEVPLSRREKPPADRWDAAIRRARAEIRALIETGDLEHDEITDAWVESWAADIHTRSRPRA